MDASTELRMKTQSHTNWDATVHQERCLQTSTQLNSLSPLPTCTQKKAGSQEGSQLVTSPILAAFYFSARTLSHTVKFTSFKMFLSNKLCQSASYHLLIHCDLPLSLEGVWHGEAILLLPISTSCVLFRHLIQSLHEP